MSPYENGYAAIEKTFGIYFARRLSAVHLKVLPQPILASCCAGIIYETLSGAKARPEGSI
jgi:hypothetical protein